MQQLRRKSFSVTLLVAASVTFAACDDDGRLNPEPREFAISTDRTEYTARRLPGAWEQYQFTVIADYTNRTSAPVYLGRCFPQSTQPKFSVLMSESRNESGYDQVWGCVGHSAQFEMMPGATRRDTFVVVGPTSFPNGSNVGRGEVDGLFQLYLDVRRARDGGDPLSPPFRVSNPFRVRIE